MSAFGYGGTNSHAVIESYQSEAPSSRTYKSIHDVEDSDLALKTRAHSYLAVFSAHDDTTLLANIKAYSAMKSVPNVVDLTYTLAERRSTFAHRAFAICRQQSITADVLDAQNTIRESVQPVQIGFAFTGD